MQIKDDLKKQNILDAVSQMIVHGGVQSVSINKVARKAGVSKGTVYVYFSSKQELLKQAYYAKSLHYHDYIKEHIRTDGTPTEQLDSFITNIYNFGTKYLADMLIIDAVVSSPLRSEIFTDGREPAELLKPWNDLMANGELQGSFKKISPYGLTFFAFHTISSYIKDVYYHNLDSNDISFDDIKALIMTGIKCN